MKVAYEKYADKDQNITAQGIGKFLTEVVKSNPRHTSYGTLNLHLMDKNSNKKIDFQEFVNFILLRVTFFLNLIVDMTA